MTMRSYSPPAVTDHGSLVDLTADFDLNFVGSVAKLVTLAAVSPAIGGVIPGAGEPPTPSGGTVAVVDSANALGGSSPAGSPDVLGAGPTVGADVGGGVPGSTAPGNGGGVAGVDAGSGGGESGGGGSLPFTGYYATLSAATGALLTTAGATLRSKLRRKS